MGKLIVDLVALLLAFLCLSGFVIWLLPKWIRRRRNKGLWQKGLRWHFRWHDRWGRYALPLLVFITLTVCTASAFASRRGSDCYTTHSWFAARQPQPLAG